MSLTDLQHAEVDTPIQVVEWDPSRDLRPVGNVVLIVVDAATNAEQPQIASRNRRAAELVSLFRAKGAPVVFVQQVHFASHIDVGRGLDSADPVSAIGVVAGSSLPQGLQPNEDDYFIEKRRSSAFYATELDIVLRGYHAETLVVVGSETDSSIHYTCVDAHQHDYHIRVVDDLLTGSNDEMHAAALRAIKYLQRDAIVSSEAVIAWLETQPATASAA